MVVVVTEEAKEEGLEVGARVEAARVVVMVAVAKVGVMAVETVAEGSERRHALQHSSTKARYEDHECRQRSRHLRETCRRRSCS